MTETTSAGELNSCSSVLVRRSAATSALGRSAAVARLAQILAAVQQQESSSSSAAAPTPGAIEKFRTTLVAEATSLLAAVSPSL